MKKLLLNNDISIPELEIFNRLSEPALAHYYEPDLGIFIAESPNVIIRALDNGYQPLLALIEDKNQEDELVNRLSKYDIDIYFASQEVLLQISGYNLTKGFSCVFKRKQLIDYHEFLDNSSRIAVLENINNPTNLGAIFRNAAAMNIDCTFLTKDCTDPLYRRSSRVSMGTVFQSPWTYLDDNWINELKQNGFKLVALALSDNYVDIDDKKLNSEEKLAIILGSEGYGLKPETLQKCDYIVKIPMSNNVDSLNVAACSAIAFYQLALKRK